MMFLLFILSAVYGSWTTMKQCLINNGIVTSQIAIEGTDSSNQANFQWNLWNTTNPTGFILVNKESDVQTTVKCAIKNKFPIVPRGGGHSYEKYSLIDSNHLVLDLSGLDTFKMDSNIATVGAGLLLGNVYYKLWMAGKFGMPAGSCPTVGISGHILGGGYGPTSRKFGLMIDQVVEMKMVDATGDLLTVNGKENSDLFFALRGAGNANYGIVTSFKIKAFDASSPVNIITTNYKKERFQEILKSWQKWAKSIPSPRATATFVAKPSNGVTFNAVIHEPDQEKARQLAEKILSFFPKGYKQSEPVITRSFIDMVIDFGDPNFAPDLSSMGQIKRNDIGSSFFKMKSNYIESYLDNDTIAQLGDDIFKFPDGDYYMIMDLQGGAISDLASNVTAFPHRTHTLFSYQVGSNTFDESSANEGIAWINNVHSRLIPFTTGRSYVNYIDSSIPNPLTSYYGTNLPRLVDIKRHRDPANIFRVPMGIPARV